MRLQELPNEYLVELKRRIERNYVITNEDCWEWVLGKAHAGHGKVSVKHKSQMVHRVYYQLVRGWLPDTLVLDHYVCDNPPCINPDHLKPVTHKENTLRGNNIIAINTRKTHCAHGHEFTPENTAIIVNRSGRHRACRTCAKAHSRRRDPERTLEYRAKGLNSKGKPMSDKWKKKYGIL